MAIWKSRAMATVRILCLTEGGLCKWLINHSDLGTNRGAAQRKGLESPKERLITSPHSRPGQSAHTSPAPMWKGRQESPEKHWTMANCSTKGLV